MKYILTLLLCVQAFLLQAAEAPGSSPIQARVQAAPCKAAVSKTIVSVNAVRLGVLNGGDHWPSIPNQPSMAGLPGFNIQESGKRLHYAGALWLGGRDDNGILSVSAQTYRQTNTLGVGFWPGPIPVNQNIQPDSSSCASWDRVWQLSKAQITTHRNEFGQPGYQAPDDLTQWPAHGQSNRSEAAFLAPFVDVNGNGLYEPQLGDYPDIAGDAYTWHVYNDFANGINGGGSIGLGVEIQEENFAYNSSGLEKAGFTRYKIINRRLRIIDSVHVGMFSDPDIGNPMDDYIGCDVSRNLGYAFNANNNDDDYGLHPPVFGLMLLEGPYADPQDGRDNDRDGQLDEMENDCYGISRNERIAMTHFSYFNNNGTVTGNPAYSTHAFNYLKGLWIDGSHMAYGGSGYLGSAGSTNVAYSFAYPGQSDPQGWGYVYAGGSATSPPFAWSEQQTGVGGGANSAGDRRFVMSSGYFRLLPGEVQTITYAGFFGRDSIANDSSAAMTSLLAQADYIRQQFDDCLLEFPNVIATNTQKINNQLNWKLYPNPVQAGLFNLQGEFEIGQPVEIHLRDLEGRKHPITIRDQQAQRLQLYSPAGTGLYLLEIKHKNQRFIQKVLIQ